MTATVTTLHAERRATEGMTGPELCVYAGITYRQLDFWTRAGHLACIGTTSPGSGNYRRYDQGEADTARTVKLLLDAGFNLIPALTCARRVQAGEEVTLAGGLVRISQVNAT